MTILWNRDVLEKNTQRMNLKVFIVLFLFLTGFIPHCTAEFHFVGGCSVCHNSHGSTSNLSFIRETIITPNSGPRAVIFTSLTGPNSYADGDNVYDGVCEVCHTATDHHRNDGINPDPAPHHDGENCVACHIHDNEFLHGGGGDGCNACHGHDEGYEYEPGKFSQGAGTHKSHSTHTENDSDDLRGPYLLCGDCHDTGDYPSFKSGTGAPPYDLSETDVCDGCHSPAGSFDGVDSQGDSIGAKDHWADGIYQEDGRLTSGYEKWCAGCHDSVPAVVNGETAPDIAGDNLSYGYYLSIHGDESSGVDRIGISHAQGECVHCHDDSLYRDSHRVPLFAPLDDPDFCMTCHTDIGSVQVGGISGGPGNMEAVFGKAYRHDVTAYAGLHLFSPEDETREYLSDNKRVECDECHNPLEVQAGLHSSNMVHVAAGTNGIFDSGPLTGALGAEPTWVSWDVWGGWNTGGSSSWPYTSILSTTEYEICFRCHSDYNTNFTSWGGSGTMSWTNLALEFNPRKQSHHPVAQPHPALDPGYEYWSPGSESDYYGSNQLPPAFTSVVIGDSGLATSKTEYTLTDSAKSWADGKWINWGLRMGSLEGVSNRPYLNMVRRITGSGTNWVTASGQPAFSLPTYTTYSIEYYAGSSTKSGTTITDTNKNFNLYLPSLEGYVVVITDTVGNNVAKGTVTSNSATQFTVGSWTALYGGVPANGTVGYYFSATGQSMMCSDCHSNDVVSSSAAQGPHGSGVKWMLKGRNRAWPTLAASENGTGTGTLRQIGNRTVPAHRSVNDGTANGLFCLNCHSTVSFSKDVNGRENAGNVHMIHSWWAGPRCVNCHIMVPHGGAVSRMIGDRGYMPARYAFNNDLSNCNLYYYQKTFDPAHNGGPGDPAGYGPSGSRYCMGTFGCHQSGMGFSAFENTKSVLGLDRRR